MKKRSQIKNEYKWDKSCLCKNDEEFEIKLEKINDYLPKFKKFEGNLKDKKKCSELYLFR